MDLPLTQSKAYIFRITHLSNVEWTLTNGVHCRSSAHYAPNYVEIGNPELIGKRVARTVPVEPGGTLSDYVPFYFTPRSPMLYNIKTGWNGIVKRNMADIVILVSSLHKLTAAGALFVFTDRHAYLEAAVFSSDLANLDRISWAQLQTCDFKRDSDDPGKMERYQAEALVYHGLPVSALNGIICYNEEIKTQIEALASALGVTVSIKADDRWYF